MHTLIHTHHQEIDDTLRRYITQRVKSALSLLVTNVNSVLIKLSSSIDHAGAKSKTCEIEVTVQGHKLVLVKSETTHWLAAIDQAVASAARAVRRTIGQSKKLKLA